MNTLSICDNVGISHAQLLEPENMQTADSARVKTVLCLSYTLKISSCFIKGQLSGYYHSPSDSVESVPDGCHTDSCSPRGHRCHHVPAICPGVVRLAVSVDGEKAAPACNTSQCLCA